MNTPSAKKSVLVIEDDAFLVKAYQMKFQKEGLDVLTANDGKAALSFLEKEPPNVVLLDLMLPGVSGFEVLSAMRANERWKNVRVLILSNLGQPQDVARAKEMKVEDYLVKANVKIADVVEKVKKYL